MAIETNFDTLKRLHDEAVRYGRGSRAWIEFAQTMTDSFPSLYQTALLCNASREDARRAASRMANSMNDLNNLVGEIPEVNRAFSVVENDVRQYSSIYGD